MWTPHRPPWAVGDETERREVLAALRSVDLEDAVEIGILETARGGRGEVGRDVHPQVVVRAALLLPRGAEAGEEVLVCDCAGERYGLPVAGVADDPFPASRGRVFA